MQDQLFNAIRTGDSKIVKSILESHPDLINKQDSRGSTPLLLATYYGNTKTSEVLLQAGADVDARDASGNTPLMGVCFKGYDQIAKLLIDNDADVNAINFNQATALIYAATFNQGKIVDLLLKAGADKSLKDTRGHTASDHARLQGLEALSKKLDHAG